GLLKAREQGDIADDGDAVLVADIDHPRRALALDGEVLEVGEFDDLDVEPLAERGLDGPEGIARVPLLRGALHAAHDLAVVEVDGRQTNAGVENDGERDQQKDPADHRDTALLAVR